MSDILQKIVTVKHEEIAAAQRKKPLSADAVALRLPASLPGALREVVQAEYGTVRADLRKLLDPATVLRPLMRPTSAFRSRYFLLDDPLAEVDDYHRSLDELDAGEELLQPASKIANTGIRRLGRDRHMSCSLSQSRHRLWTRCHRCLQ